MLTLIDKEHKKCFKLSGGPQRKAKVEDFVCPLSGHDPLLGLENSFFVAKTYIVVRKG